MPANIRSQNQSFLYRSSQKGRAGSRTLVTALVASLALVLTGCADTVQSQRVSTPSIRMPSAAFPPNTSVRRIAIGSCYSQKRNDDRVWEALRAAKPDLFIYAGDTLYADDENDKAGLPDLRAAYANLADLEPFAALRADVPVLPIWDDHDFGMNDGGADFRRRDTAEALFEEAWYVPLDDPRRQRPGVYHSFMRGNPGERLHVILLDTRFFRSPLKVTDEYGERGKERYTPDDDPSKTLLGAEQWRWLQAELARPADLRFVVSSIQVLADGHGWEAWRQLPKERERLFAALREASPAPVFLFSGDRHVAGFYEQDVGLPTPLLEFTSSALNNTIPDRYRKNTLAEAGPHRLGDLYGEANFGTVDIDWTQRLLKMTLRDAMGEPVREERRRF